MDPIINALDLLADLEWSGRKYYDVPCCPCCHGLALQEEVLATLLNENVGHTPDCRLWALVRKHGPHHP